MGKSARRSSCPRTSWPTAPATSTTPPTRSTQRRISSRPTAGAPARDTNLEKPTSQLFRHGMPLPSISEPSLLLANRSMDDKAILRGAEDRARKESAYQFHLPRSLRHQRESTSGPAGGGGRGTGDDCTADDCALGCGGFCGGAQAASLGRDRGPGVRL